MSAREDSCCRLQRGTGIAREWLLSLSALARDVRVDVCLMAMAGKVLDSEGLFHPQDTCTSRPTYLSLLGLEVPHQQARDGGWRAWRVPIERADLGHNSQPHASARYPCLKTRTSFGWYWSTRGLLAAGQRRCRRCNRQQTPRCRIY